MASLYTKKQQKEMKLLEKNKYTIIDYPEQVHKIMLQGIENWKRYGKKK